MVCFHSVRHILWVYLPFFLGYVAAQKLQPIRAPPVRSGGNAALEGRAAASPFDLQNYEIFLWGGGGKTYFISQDLPILGYSVNH